MLQRFDDSGDLEHSSTQIALALKTELKCRIQGTEAEAALAKLMQWTRSHMLDKLIPTERQTPAMEQ